MSKVIILRNAIKIMQMAQSHSAIKDTGWITGDYMDKIDDCRDKLIECGCKEDDIAILREALYLVDGERVMQ